MIDIHSHILPGIDDGPDSVIEFINMAYDAVGNGITDVIATPHHLNGYFYNPKEKIMQMVLQSEKYLQNEGIPLRIHPGQEVRLQQHMLKNFDAEILTLNNNGNFLLIELPSNNIPNYIYDILYELKMKRIIPIIVHPERNIDIENNPNILIDFIRNGALIQITAGSILGHFGRRIKYVSEKLIEHHIVHFIASDAHNSQKRKFILNEAYEVVTRSYGKEFTMYYKNNAKNLLSGEMVEKKTPIIIRKKILGLF